MDVIRSSRISIPSDLSETAFEDAIIQLKAKAGEKSPKFLITGEINAVLAGRLAQKYGLNVVILPGINRDYWAVTGEYACIWSPGA
jgi:hypothetical protein